MDDDAMDVTDEDNPALDDTPCDDETREDDTSEEEIKEDETNEDERREEAITEEATEEGTGEDAREDTWDDNTDEFILDEALSPEEDEPPHPLNIKPLARTQGSIRDILPAVAKANESIILIPGCRFLNNCAGNPIELARGNLCAALKMPQICDKRGWGQVNREGAKGVFANESGGISCFKFYVPGVLFEITANSTA